MSRVDGVLSFWGPKGRRPSKSEAFPFVKWKETLVVGRVTSDILHLLDTPLLVASYLHGPSGSPDHTGLSQGPFVGSLLRAVGDFESAVAFSSSCV